MEKTYKVRIAGVRSEQFYLTYMQYNEILKKFKSLYNPEAVKGMARYGINPKNNFGVSIPTLRNMAKEIGKNHVFAKKLWESGIHEGRILASLIDDPEMVTEQQAEDKEFLKFLPIIKKESTDDRNYVKKAVNWALRNIGKRNLNLNKMAIETAKEIQKIDSKSAKWIASDAIRELTSKAIQKKMKK